MPGTPGKTGRVLLAAAIILNVAAIGFFVHRYTEVLQAERFSVPKPVQVAARVKHSRGEVLVKHIGDIDYQRLSGGDALRMGDSVRTGGGAAALLEFWEGTRLNLGENSQVVIQEGPGGGSFDSGGVEVHSGSVSVERPMDTEGKIALRTPGALIDFRVRVIALYRPSMDGRETAVIGSVAAGGASTAALGLDYLEKMYWKFVGGAAGNGSAGTGAMARVRTACTGSDEAVCLAAQEGAWAEVADALRRGRREQKVRVSVSETGESSIEVETGAVRIETPNRNLALAEGDKKLDLRPGEVAVRRSASEDAFNSIMPRDRREELFFEIETMNWQ